MSWPLVMPPSRPPARFGSAGEAPLLALIVDGVLNFRSESRRTFGSESDFDTFDGLHRHDGLRQLPIQARVPGDVRSEAGRDAVRHHFENASDRVSGPVGLVDDGFHPLFGFRVDAIEQDVVLLTQGHKFIPGGEPIQAGFTHGDHVAKDSDPEFGEVGLGERTRRHSSRGFRALARSKIYRASCKSYLRAPARSA